MSANHGEQVHAGKELTLQTCLQLTERNYIKDIIGEKCHMTPTHTQHITVCDFIDLTLYSTRTGNADATGAREK